MRRAHAVVLALTILAVPATAEVYQWRDAEGRVHFSDRPPAEEDAKLLRGKPRVTPPATEAGKEAAGAAAEGDGKQAGTAAGEPQAPKTLTEKELEFRQRRAQAAEMAAKAEEEKARTAERDRDCERARNQLTALTSGQRVSRFNSKGEREYLDDSARAAEIERAQQYIAKTCK